MFKKIVFALLVLVFLSACGAQSQNSVDDGKKPVAKKNPKEAKVSVEAGLATITIPGHVPYFWFEKVADDSVPFAKIYFRYDAASKSYFYQTDLESWQPLVLENNAVQEGKMKLVFSDEGVTITYPSGTWAFP